MRVSSANATPFDEGKRAAKLGAAADNPHADGSVEHRNYELGRQFGLRHLSAGDTFRARGPAA